MSSSTYLVLAYAGILLAYSAVLVLFVLRVHSASKSEYAADRPHWGKWILLLLATLIYAAGPVAFFGTLAIRLLR